MDVQIHHNTLQVGELHITFHRTLRIPDNGRKYPLPPSLGSFPLERVDDHADRVPAEWRERGGVFLPMYQREAMWISFRGPHHKPRAVKIGVGKVCAITGKRWSEALGDKKQDYIVTPPQPWLDGICAGHGTIKQFVAMPLGSGYTVEGQVTGEEKFGGMQIKVFDPKPGRFPDAPPPPTFANGITMAGGLGAMPQCSAAGAMPPPAAAPGMAPRRAKSRGRAMGLAAGGKMKQKIYPDPHGRETWDPDTTGRVFVHLCNSEMYREITGKAPPSTPVTAESYMQHGLPWFDVYDEGEAALDTTATLADVKSVAELDGALDPTGPVKQSPVKSFITKAKQLVRDGSW